MTSRCGNCGADLTDYPTSAGAHHCHFTDTPTALKLPPMPTVPEYRDGKWQYKDRSSCWPSGAFVKYNEDRCIAVEARLKALAGYAGHWDGCADYDSPDDDCACGLSALYEQLREEGLIP